MKNATDTNDGDYVALGSNPSFSPDGTKIVYTNSGLLYEKVLSAN